MAAGDSPAGARRRLRLAIREIREAAALTQGQVADELAWSISKVNRIETGEVTISRTDLQALLHLFSFHDEAATARLFEDARLSRVRGWWDRPEFRPYIDRTLRQIVQLESEADAIRSFQFAVFPGLLQTREYADAIIGAVRPDLSPEARTSLLDVRMLRQEHLRKRHIRPQQIIILDELLLQRVIGSAAVTVQQLKALLEAVREPDVHVRLLPKEESAYLMSGSFVIYDVDGHALLYREERLADDIVEHAATVQRYQARFEQMWEKCLGREATTSVIEAHYALNRADLNRSR